MATACALACIWGHGTAAITLAGLVWVVDEESETVYVCRAGQERSRLGKGDTLEGGEVLPGFALELCELFEDPFGGGPG